MLSRWVLRLSIAASIGLVVGGCKPARRVHNEDDISLASAEPKAEAKPEAPEPALPPGSISRARVDQWLLRGPANLLQKVQVSAIHRQNKFVGWRIDHLSGELEGSGLQAGDVVTSANAMTLETQDDFFDVWEKMSEAPELHIAYERDGKPGEAVLKIVGAPDPQTKRRLDEGTPPPQQGTARTTDSPRKVKPQSRGTVVITDELGGQNNESE